MTRLRTLAALAALALVIAGCSNRSATSDSTVTVTGSTTSTSAHAKAVRFAECMRQNGVSGFPDPDATGKMTIDGIANSSSLDTSSAAFTEAISACSDLEPAGFTGHTASAHEQDARLAFAQCMRDHGVKDFPDPTRDSPLIDTNRIPSSGRPGGMGILNAAVHTCTGIYKDRLGLT